MNNAFVYNDKIGLVVAALDALRDSAGIQGEILEHGDADADAATSARSSSTRRGTLVSMTWRALMSM
ncbi:hypothetical protein [Massilia rhizosphaerae]|uniref:hypothetical protein n=1 Tax=Massilia rhizosphaerae TaxID=2784389 RepID=UPI0018DC859C|nr:hypothetical protein [Massilia rhizosphaerae]